MGCGAAVGLTAATAAAGLAGSAISAIAAGGAANTEANAANNATAASQQEAAQTRADLAPYNQAGQTGTNALLASLGLGGTGANLLAANGINSLTFQPTQAQLEATPGYQFDLNQGLQATQNANAAQGLGVSGAALKGAASYATGLANNTLTTQQGIFQQNLENVINPLQNLASTGENASAETGVLGTQNISNANQAAIGGANASAAGQVGTANAISSGLSGLGNAGTNYLLYNSLLNNSSGLTAGPNIQWVGTSQGFGSGSESGNSDVVPANLVQT